ncbi:MAG: FecR family protein [Gammaproteobacteria bacterium]|nr:FecR family protein [Gammaproteobacteria bacterium]
MKPQLNNTDLTSRARRIGLAGCIAAALTLGSAVASAQTALTIADTSDVVGEVSLVLGRAWLEGSEGRAMIAAGTPVRASDRILTESNGHVHIRFVDQALVSVRPDSRLEIVQYDYNADQPQRSAIKLSLEEGITRSISGHGATSARERFRLNTPIAAIGVRGTDFVVNASPGSVRALVNEGAIILAPYSSECTAATFGPCLTNAVELTDSALQMIELDGSSTAPRLLPATVEREPGMQQEIQTAVVDAEASAEDKTAGTGVYLENVTSQRVKAEVSAVNPTPRPQPPTIAVVDFTPPELLTSSALRQNNLVWGRFGGEGFGAQERITTSYAAASAGRDITIGGNAGAHTYLLFREGKGSTQIRTDGMGPVSFSLESAQAFYSSASGVVAMAVNGGKLDINFDNNQFATELNLNHFFTGKVDFVASGKLDSAGYFRSDAGTGNLAGAISLDGAEAGYFFEQQLLNGGIQGLTLWDKR